ncbi:MAG: putative metal-binding motif-containing protein [Myxococcales bacterium]|nr:putative metal-binding motif-containing protein [Myxococcales bacterium]
MTRRWWECPGGIWGAYTSGEVRHPTATPLATCLGSSARTGYKPDLARSGYRTLLGPSLAHLQTHMSTGQGALPMRSIRHPLRYVVIVLLAAGCSGNFTPAGQGPGTPTGPDLDKDGYVASQDCDDNNASISPGAPEIPGNGIDDNCNGQIDEPSSSTPGPYNPSPGDPDGDGFTAAEGDCNNNDPRVNPAAIEVAGIACTAHTDCASNRCVAGFCRCVDDNMCSTNAGCQADAQCTTPGETCQGGKCRSTFRCLAANQGLASPELKVCRDDVDNNCNGTKDELPVACDTTSLNPADPRAYAAAIGLCDSTTACNAQGQCPGNMACVNGKCSHLISAAFDPSSSPQGRTIAQRLAQATGPLGTARQGNAMAVLSTGRAVYNPQNNADCPQPGTELGNRGVDPDPTAQDREANDIQALTLTIAVPSNAHGFSFDFHFLTTEYPEYLDSEFNDTFWVHLKSSKHNGNISFDKNGSPIRLNSSFFAVCDPDPARPKTQTFCTTPASALVGTGYFNSCKGDFGPGGGGFPGGGYPGYPGGAGNTTVQSNGGSTGWLTTRAPVTPGETITLTFYIFDKGDLSLDSTVLIDNFRWELTPAAGSAPPVTKPIL